ncbi:hypothetical protein NPIL_215901 [Nephila pilipes]|uniref:Uncharacterized protein n=1 Tax=Nephila pilipes TaxID=299642 RepID=A0A8X6NFC5_NEPPI|nr:hypothetical protein NPIL_215901 [Nephila pilipes]
MRALRSYIDSVRLMNTYDSGRCSGMIDPAIYYVCDKCRVARPLQPVVPCTRHNSTHSTPEHSSSDTDSQTLVISETVAYSSSDIHNTLKRIKRTFLNLIRWFRIVFVPPTSPISLSLIVNHPVHATGNRTITLCYQFHLSSNSLSQISSRNA